ncbi:UNVERIFIED_CONTAM: hypothetical protein FKN15_039868 [Acipenser sinensis]
MSPSLQEMNNEGPPCSQPRATVSEDNAALGSLQASPQEPSQSTGVAGPPCSQPRATVSEDNAALGSLQASPQEPSQSTGVAGVW